MALAGLFVLGLIDIQQTKQQLASPIPGDVYIVKMAEFEPGYQQNTYPYGVLKISSAEGENVYFIIASNTYGNMKVHAKLYLVMAKKALFIAPNS